jgi:hypothetical protein
MSVMAVFSAKYALPAHIPGRSMMSFAEFSYWFCAKLCKMHILISISNLALLLLLQVIYSTCAGLRLVTSPGHTVVKRQETVQGWALVEDNCPDGLGVCGKRSCCPYGSYCDDEENTNSNLCCPTSKWRIQNTVGKF